MVYDGLYSIIRTKFCLQDRHDQPANRLRNNNTNVTRKCSRKKFKPQELQGMTRPQINSTGNFIYKHVDIYFLAGWQARAVE